MNEIGNEEQFRYTRLTGNTAKYPYLVGVVTPETLGSGILLDSYHVLTCNHVLEREDPAREFTEITVVTASGPIVATVEFVDKQFDLALLRLASAAQPDAIMTDESPLRSGSPLIAVGVQPVLIEPETLMAADVEVNLKNSNKTGNVVIDIQMDGGPRPGYSGGPVLQRRGQSLFCVGMTQLGGPGLAAGNAIGIAGLRAFVEQILPGRNLLGARNSAVGVFERYLSFSRRAREGLNPHFLQRIPRAVVRDKYLPAIRRGVSGKAKRIVPIIAPAGYGKSTLLGEIYDTLVTEGNAVLLLRCNDLTISADMPDWLSMRIGEAVSPPGEEGQQIEEIIKNFAAARPDCILLIDTLDLILNSGLVPVLRGLLFSLTDFGATVVFTCRDYEYETFLEPVQDKLSGLGSIVDRYEVPPFNSEEVIEAAQKFMHMDPQKPLPPKAASFGKQILSLSADNRPLRELVSNPLLLALTCTLFGKSGEVPRDLTVSRLYTIYWEQKIARSWNQKFAPGSPVAIRKEQISLQLAGALALRSGTYLVDSLFLADLGLPSDPDTVAAQSNLFSEDVLQKGPSGRISFFHQTFLEYAIARWLMMETGRVLRSRILTDLSQGSFATPLYWWPVIRQMLTMTLDREFVDFAERLDLSRLAAFRTAAFAAASRDGSAALTYLGKKSLTLPSEYQHTLLLAIDKIPPSLLEEALCIAIVLLRHANERVAVHAAQLTGDLFSRCQTEQETRLTEIFEAIWDRPEPSVQEQGPAALMGAFLRSLCAREGWMPSAAVRKILRECYLCLGDTHRSFVVAVHLGMEVTLEEQIDLIRNALTQPLSNSNHPEELRLRMVSLCEMAIFALLPPGDSAGNDTLLPALHAQLPKGWERIQVTSVGAILAREQESIDEIIQDLLTAAGKERLSRNLRSLQHAATLGIATTLSLKIMSLHRDIPVVAVNAMRDLCITVARELPRQERERLLGWADAVLGKSSYRRAIPEELSFDVDAGEVIESLAAIEYKGVLREKIIKVPQERVDALMVETLRQLQMQPDNRRLQIILLELNLKLAATSRQGVLGLVELSLSEYESVATKASFMVAELARDNESLKAEDVRSLARSRFPGIRRNRLESLINILNRKGIVPECDLDDICASLLREQNSAIINRTYDAVMLWVDANRRITDKAANDLASSIRQLLKDGKANDGLVRSMLITLKLLAYTEDPHLAPFLILCVRDLIVSVDIGKPSNGEADTADLLCAMERIVPRFIESISDHWPTMHTKNLRAIVSAIRNIEGPRSPLLDKIRHADWCPDKVKSLILSIQGL